MTNDFPSVPAGDSAGYGPSELAAQADGAAQAQQQTQQQTQQQQQSHLQAQQTVAYPADALVAVQAGLIFVTTGQMACHQLGAELDQVALTPTVAWRIAEALRETLQHADMHERQLFIGVWSASEIAAMPHGIIALDERFVQVGIEPIGAGARVTVAWDFVPGLIVSLENAVQWSQAGG